MDENELRNAIEFAKETDKLSSVERQIFNEKLNRFETSAEHSWHVSMLILIFQPYFPPKLNIERMLKLAIIHDLPEIYVGDTYAYDSKARDGKEKREKQAEDTLLQKSPAGIHPELADLFSEYREKSTPESQMVNALDKLQPIIHNLTINKGGWNDRKVTLDRVDAYKRPHVEKNAFTKKLYETLMQEAVERKLIQTKKSP